MADSSNIKEFPVFELLYKLRLGRELLQQHGIVLGTIYLLLILGTTYFIIKTIYYAFFHPLRNFPGPFWAGATYIPWLYNKVTGNMGPWQRALHTKYGDFVRYGPNSVSIGDGRAFKNIYQAPVKGFRKSPRAYQMRENGSYDLVCEPDDKTHHRIRKIFLPAFSEKALRLQEPMIMKYVNDLIGLMNNRLHNEPDGPIVDLTALYNFTTFDIMGDLCFGEPLGLLKEAQYTPWVWAVFAGFKYGVIADAIDHVLGGWIKPIIFALNKAEAKHYEFSSERVNKRLKAGREGEAGAGDIWNLVLNKDGTADGLTLEQMHTNAGLFMLAGTETTATGLCGLTYLLLKNPKEYQRLKDEVRALNPEDLNLEKLARLPILNACIEEGLRVYSPAAEGQERLTPPQGAEIAGRWVPGNVIVEVPHSVITTREHYFRDAHKFIPDRWLPDTGYEQDHREFRQPFSVGIRNCVGKPLAYHELRIITASVVYNFDFELQDDSKQWIETQKGFSLWDKPALHVKIRHAQKA